MPSCFLITGGGTGAKVAEAYVHLCAAGAGPEKLHVLILDADTNNGNVKRAAECVEAYNKLQPWGWQLHPHESDPLQFFGTHITPYMLTERISDELGGSLIQVARGDMELHEILDLLYDRKEQESDHTVGFLARANLGCLVLAEHLDRSFAGAGANKQPKAFIRALRNALKAGEEVRVVVAGSVFGGTGASLLPVAKQCVLRALKEEDPQRLSFAAVMMLPYFSPRDRLESVDPKRFLLDASLALQYYGVTDFAAESTYDTLYLLGSEQPARHSHQLPISVNGGARQRNPPFVEEWLAALAVNDFANRGVNNQERVRIYLRGGAGDEITWENLPIEGSASREAHIDHLSYLLHGAAFYLRSRSGTSGALSAGLHELLNATPGAKLRFFSWFDTLLHPWAETEHPTYKQGIQRNVDRWELLQEKIDSSSGHQLQAALADYFVRLLGWAWGALRAEGTHLLEAPVAQERGQDYARLFSAMCDVTPTEIEQGGLPAPYSKDNTAARLVRASLVAMHRAGRENYRQPGLHPLGNPITLRRRDAGGKLAVVPLMQFEELQAAADRVGKRIVLDSYLR